MKEWFEEYAGTVIYAVLLLVIFLGSIGVLYYAIMR